MVANQIKNAQGMKLVILVTVSILVLHQILAAQMLSVIMKITRQTVAVPLALLEMLSDAALRVSNVLFLVIITKNLAELLMLCFLKLKLESANMMMSVKMIRPALNTTV